MSSTSLTRMTTSSPPGTRLSGRRCHAGDPVDTVTLEHFAAADRLELLEKTFYGFDEPRWVEQVKEEVLAGAGLSKSRKFCVSVLRSRVAG
ncbi:hypothetical protein ACU8V6_00020 [Vibrio alginolyticus]